MAVERVIIEITGDTTKIQSTIAELEKLGKVDKSNSDSFKRTNKQFNDDLSKTKNNLGGFGDQLNSLKQQVLGAFAVSSLIAFGKEAVQTAAKIESIGNSLKFITGSSANAEKTMNYLRDLSNRLGLEFESTAQAFKLFAGATTQAGMTLGQTKAIFESVSKAVTTMGLSADDANGVFLALSQIMSKGKVSAEELRGQIGERLPGAFSIAAKSIGVTEQQLNKMLEQGQVISKDFLPKFAKQLEKDLGGGAEAAANSTQAALNRLKNSFDDFLLYAGQKLAPAVNLLSKVFQGLTYAMRGEAGEREAASRQQGIEYGKKVIEQLEKINDLNERSDANLEKRNFYNKRIFDTQQEINKLLDEKNKLENTPQKNFAQASVRIGNINKEIEALAGNKYMYEEILNSLKEYDAQLTMQNGTIDENTTKTKENTKAKEKELNDYEKLVKAARDTEEALQILYAKGEVADNRLEVKLRSLLKQIELVNDRVEMAKTLAPMEMKGLPIVKSKAEIDKQTQDQIIENGKRANEEFARLEEERTRKFIDEQEKRKQIRQIELDASMQIINIGLDYAFQAKQREYDYELRLLDDMLANKKITEDEYNRRKKEIQQKDAESQKEYAVFKATLDTANAILNALATGGTAAPALAIAAGVVGAAQIASILATPLPQYAEGTDFVGLGKNKKGKDTIPALLNEGEAVITTEQNAMYPGMAKAWNDGKLDEHIYKKWVLPELVMNKSFEQQRQRSFAENVAKSIQLNQDFGGIETKLKRIDETEKAVGAMIVGAIKESKNKNIW